MRVCEDSIIDLMPLEMASGIGPLAKFESSAGLAVRIQSEYQALDRRLQAAGVDTSARLTRTYGARGWAPHAYYFADPDGNVVEARYYG